jgi:tRNA pseudouridine55 synthase
VQRAADAAGFILNVYKEIPWTSHDAVARVRRILDWRSVGHAGSLDPFASGVLLVAVGRATKVVSHLMELPKRYRGTLRFGRRTATGDGAGAELETGPVPDVSADRLRAAAAAFLGKSWQTPPMVSAVKVDGKRLYDLARRGVEVERRPREILIHRFEILAAEPPRVDFELECSRGTYVRTLVEDFAAKFGALAFVECLTRTGVGRFDVADSCRLISLPCSQREGLLAQAVPMAEALQHLTGATVEGRLVHRLRQGILPPWKALRFTAQPRIGETVRLLGPEGDLLALAVCELLPGPADRPIEQASSLRLERVL